MADGAEEEIVILQDSGGKYTKCDCFCINVFLKMKEALYVEVYGHRNT